VPRKAVESVTSGCANYQDLQPPTFPFPSRK